MTTLRTITGPAWRRLARHYLEMVVAMIAGMAVLGPLESWLLASVGRPDLRALPALDVLVMATNMTVAMVAWMRVRGHGWASCGEMAAVMYGAFLLLLPPLWLGALSAGAFMMLGHVLMFVAMAVLMLLRVDEYSGHHHASVVRRLRVQRSTSTAGR